MDSEVSMVHGHGQGRLGCRSCNAPALLRAGFTLSTAIPHFKNAHEAFYTKHRTQNTEHSKPLSPPPRSRSAIESV